MFCVRVRVRANHMQHNFRAHTDARTPSQTRLVFRASGGSRQVAAESQDEFLAWTAVVPSQTRRGHSPLRRLSKSQIR